MNMNYICSGCHRYITHIRSSLITDQCCLNIFLRSDFEFTLEHVSTIINYFIVCNDNKRLLLNTLRRDNKATSF